MTAVTGKFVLKCRTTKITTLFDISLFYVYNFFYIKPHRDIAHSTPLPLGEGQGLLVMCYVLYVIFYFSSTISPQHS